MIINRSAILAVLAMAILAVLAMVPACPVAPPDPPSGECTCLGGMVCVEPAEGDSFCAEPCEAAGDCDLDHTCVLDLGACLEICAPAGPGCDEGEACLDMGKVSACAPEAAP